MKRFRVGENSMLIAGLGLAAIGLIISACTSVKKDPAVEIRKQSLHILLNAQKEDNSFARSAAAKAMGDSRDPDVLPLLEGLRADPDPTVRLFSVEAAANFGSQTATRFIRDALSDPDASVRLTAVRMLSGMKRETTTELLTRALRDQDPAVQWMGLGVAVAHQGTGSYPDAVQIFSRAIKGEYPEARLTAAAAIGKTGDVQMLPLLATVLKDPVPTVRSYAAQALGDLGTIHAIPFLSEALTDPDAEVRSQAVTALGAYQTDSVLPLLQQAAQDSDAFVRLSAAVMLAKHRDPQALELLRSAVAESDYGIRSAAARSIGEISSWSYSAAEGDGTEALRLLIPLLEDPVSRVRSAAARALGMIGNPGAQSALFRRLNDDEPSVRCYAAGALLRLTQNREKQNLAAK